MLNLRKFSVRLIAVFLLIGAIHAPGYAQIAVVYDRNYSEIEPLVTAVRRGAGSQAVRLFDLRNISRTNSIERGKFLSRIADAELVVPLGTSAANFIAEELEDARTFFVDGGSLSGEYLRLRNIAGILPYNPEEVVRVIRGLRPGIGSVGIASTRGYESIIAEVRTAAERAGLKVNVASIGTRKDVGPAIRSLTASSDLIWLIGDPIVGADAGLKLVVESALSFRKPIVGSNRRQVEAGALFCMTPDMESLALQTDRSIRNIVNGRFQLPVSRIVTGPAGGTITYHGPLAERLGITFKPDLKTERIR